MAGGKRGGTWKGEELPTSEEGGQRSRKALSMPIIMNIFIKETEARELWERCAEREGEPPRPCRLGRRILHPFLSMADHL